MCVNASCEMSISGGYDHRGGISRGLWGVLGRILFYVKSKSRKSKNALLCEFSDKYSLCTCAFSGITRSTKSLEVVNVVCMNSLIF